MQAYAIRMRGQGKLLGLVPTMGCLHEGHLSLIDVAQQRCDLTFVSIFVNPTQFGPNEDYESYPRQREEDLAACERCGVDTVFYPRAEEIYPADFSTYVIEEKLGRGLCGVSRPGHFRGVTTVVAILFNVCYPDVAVFGQKDAQQSAIIRKMVIDLRLPVEVVIAPTTREPDGLALSSRNVYLDVGEREDAARLFKALQAGKALVDGGHLSVDRIKAEVQHLLMQSRKVRPIYIEIVNKATMEPEREIRPGRSLLAVACWVERTRLIDNILL